MGTEVIANEGDLAKVRRTKSKTSFRVEAPEWPTTIVVGLFKGRGALGGAATPCGRRRARMTRATGEDVGGWTGQRVEGGCAGRLPRQVCRTRRLRGDREEGSTSTEGTAERSREGGGEGAEFDGELANNIVSSFVNIIKLDNFSV